MLSDEFKNNNWSKRRLPHYDSSNTFQFITYRLNDSISKDKIDSIKLRYDPSLNPQEYRHEIDKVMDSGYGSCLLNDKNCASIVLDSWKFFDGEKYDLIAYVIMPNHVHLLIKTFEGHQLSEIIHSWKSFTSSLINKKIGRKGKLWQREYWDRFIRNEKHFYKTIDYIHMNPVKAGLVESQYDWRFSSALSFKDVIKFY